MLTSIVRLNALFSTWHVADVQEVVVANAVADALDAWRQSDDPATKALLARGVQTLQFVFHEEGGPFSKKT